MEFPCTGTDTGESVTEIVMGQITSWIPPQRTGYIKWFVKFPDGQVINLQLEALVGLIVQSHNCGFSVTG
jgi:hypothetical protein